MNVKLLIQVEGYEQEYNEMNITPEEFEDFKSKLEMKMLVELENLKKEAENK